MPGPTPPLDVTRHATAQGDPSQRLSALARSLSGSEILKIAADIRELVAAGHDVCNLTVGDFSPAQFPIPERLKRGIVEALDAGHTNYPPSNGVPELRQAVRRFYARALGLDYPVESVLIAGGARPLIYGTYRAVVDPGQGVVYPVPSWNNNHYVSIVGARGIPLACRAEDRFLPTADAVIAALGDARLVCINSPLNPTGTALEADVLRSICEGIVAENARRERAGAPCVYLMYDHIYWMLCVEGVEHVTPPQLVPEMARWTIFIDGISKAFAATGVRVGWALGPTDVIARMNAFVGHVGAWAPRAEQIATVAVLDDEVGLNDYHGNFMAQIGQRLRRLYDGLMDLRARGLDVDALAPMGAIYLTARIAPFGKTTPDGRTLRSNEDVRRYLLDSAKVGLVPFQAFGVPGDDGWFRLSVGAISVEEAERSVVRIGEALAALR